MDFPHLSLLFVYIFLSLFKIRLATSSSHDADPNLNSAQTDRLPLKFVSWLFIQLQKDLFLVDHTQSKRSSVDVICKRREREVEDNNEIVILLAAKIHHRVQWNDIKNN